MWLGCGPPKVESAGSNLQRASSASPRSWELLAGVKSARSRVIAFTRPDHDNFGLQELDDLTCAVEWGRPEERRKERDLQNVVDRPLVRSLRGCIQVLRGSSHFRAACRTMQQPQQQQQLPQPQQPGTQSSNASDPWTSDQVTDTAPTVGPRAGNASWKARRNHRSGHQGWPSLC